MLEKLNLPEKRLIVSGNIFWKGYRLVSRRSLCLWKHRHLAQKSVAESGAVTLRYSLVQKAYIAKWETKKAEILTNFMKNAKIQTDSMSVNDAIREEKCE